MNFVLECFEEMLFENADKLAELRRKAHLATGHEKRILTKYADSLERKLSDEDREVRKTTVSGVEVKHAPDVDPDSDEDYDETFVISSGTIYAAPGNMPHDEAIAYAAKKMKMNIDPMSLYMFNRPISGRKKGNVVWVWGNVTPHIMDEIKSYHTRVSLVWQSEPIKGAKKDEAFLESAFFSKNSPVNTGGRIVPRKLKGLVYHGSSSEDTGGWFDVLQVDDEAAAVWVTPEEPMAKRFAQGRSRANFVFVNKYMLNGIKAAELDQKAYNRISSQNDFEDDDRDMRYALADYLSGKGYDAWLTTGSISQKPYEDIAIFQGSESEARYEGTSFLLKDGSWTPYDYFEDEDKVKEYLTSIGVTK